MRYPTYCLMALIVVCYVTTVMIAVLLPFQWYVVSLALMTLGAYLSFTVMHEASHHLIQRGNRTVNTVAGWVFALPLVIAYPVFVFNHMQHHAYTDTERDPDYWLAGSFIGAVGKSLLVPIRYTLNALVWRKDKMPHKLRQQSLVYYIMLFIVVCGLTIGGYGMLLLWYWLLPALLTSIVLVMTLAWFPHHSHLNIRGFSQTQPEQGIVDVQFPLAKWLLLGQSDHSVHHSNPRLPWFEYTGKD